MALEFQPPPDWLLKGYLDRPQPAQQASDSINQALQAYVQQKDQKQKEDLAQQQKDIEMAKGIAGNGQDFTDAYKQIVASRTAPATAAQPGTSLIDRAKAFFTGSNTGKSPDTATPPPSYMPPAQSTGTMPSPMSPGLAQNTNVVQSTMPEPSPMPQGTPVSESFMTPTGQLDQGALDAYKAKHGSQGMTAIEKQLALSNTLHTAAERNASTQIPFEDVGTTFQAANEKAIGDKLIADAKAAGLNYVPAKKMDYALKGLGVKNAGMRGGALDSMAATREALMRDTLNKEARNTLSPFFQSGEGRQQAARLNLIGRANPLFTQMLGQDNGGDVRQMRESANLMDRLLKGGGAGSETQVEGLMPQTAKGKFASWKEWFSNDPQGTEQQAFVKRFQDTFAREQTAIQGQVRNLAESAAPTLRVLKQHYPEDYQVQLDSVLKNPVLVGADQPPPSDLVHLSTKELQDLRKKMTAHQSNGN